MAHSDDMTELEEYQEWVDSTTSYEGNEQAWWAASGLTAEAGEVMGLFEKAARKNEPISMEKLISEMGDVLWFLAALANSVDLTLDEVIEHNIEKINERRARGALTSEG